MKYRVWSWGVALSISLVASPLLAATVGDPVAGKEKTSMCEGCHGIKDYRTAYPSVYNVPKLGGQHATYIIDALKEYQNGKRHHPSMDAIAASLSEQDMADIAAYYSGESAKQPSGAQKK